MYTAEYKHTPGAAYDWEARLSKPGGTEVFIYRAHGLRSLKRTVRKRIRELNQIDKLNDTRRGSVLPT